MLLVSHLLFYLFWIWKLANIKQ